MKKNIKRIIHPFYKKYHFWYHKKPRKYRYEKVYTIVQPTVFSPINTISTKVFLDYISTLNLKNKTVLELGCGSGIISIFCASKGAKVTASDINKIALQSLEQIAEAQNCIVNCVYTDLFKNIQGATYDYMFINPPYYPKKPKSTEEEAWFCGENFEYFEKLFQQLVNNLATNTFMILSNDCNLQKIQKIALKNNLVIIPVISKRLMLENNVIYKISIK